jgi:hypothetical protein
MFTLKKLMTAALLTLGQAEANQFFFDMSSMMTPTTSWPAPNFVESLLNHHQAKQYQRPVINSGFLYNILKQNPEKLATNNHLLDQLLISKRGYHHLLYDEAMNLIQ